MSSTVSQPPVNGPHHEAHRLAGLGYDVVLVHLHTTEQRAVPDSALIDQAFAESDDWAVHIRTSTVAAVEVNSPNECPEEMAWLLANENVGVLKLEDGDRHYFLLRQSPVPHFSGDYCDNILLHATVRETHEFLLIPAPGVAPGIEGFEAVQWVRPPVAVQQLPQLPEWLTMVVYDREREAAGLEPYRVTGDERHPSLLKVIRLTVRQPKGYSDGDLRALVTVLNRRDCDPPLPGDDIESLLSVALDNPNWTMLEDSDDNNGVRFAVHNHQDCRYCVDQDKWYVWDGQRWKPDSTRTQVGWLARRAATEMGELVAPGVWTFETQPGLGCAAVEGTTKSEPSSDDVKRELGLTEEEYQKRKAAWLARQRRHIRRLQSHSGKLNMLSAAAELPFMRISVDQFDSRPFLLNTPNGTYDLATGEFREHRRSDLLTQITATRYDPEADCPRWIQFLDEVIEGGREGPLGRYLHQLFGYACTGCIQDQLLPVFCGEGSNGKSVMLGVLSTLLGDYACHADQGLLTATSVARHPTHLARLRGRRFVTTIETDEDQRMNESMVKSLTGGDKIEARCMREDPWSFTPTHKIFMATNHRPSIRDMSHGMWRRLKVIPFTRIFSEAELELGLEKRLVEEEAAGILNWLIDGARLWIANGMKLETPAIVSDQTADYRRDSDQMGQFLEECCIRDPDGHAGSTNLYRAYTNWCRSSGELPKTRTKFGRELARRGFEKRKSNNVLWLGIRLEPYPCYTMLARANHPTSAAVSPVTLPNHPNINACYN